MVVVGSSSKVYIGCNIENVLYLFFMCVERVVLFKVILEGESEIKVFYIIGFENEFILLCGVCR